MNLYVSRCCWAKNFAIDKVLELMAITEDQDRTCWPVDTVCYKYNSLLQVRKQENHIIPIIPCPTVWRRRTGEEANPTHQQPPR